jgi:hypothetical protein
VSPLNPTRRNFLKLALSAAGLAAIPAFAFLPKPKAESPAKRARHKGPSEAEKEFWRTRNPGWHFYDTFSFAAMARFSTTPMFPS